MAWTKADKKAFDRAYAQFRKIQAANIAKAAKLAKEVNAWYEKVMRPYWDDPKYVDPKGRSARIGGPPSRTFQMRQYKIMKKIKLSDADKPLTRGNRKAWDQLMDYGTAMAQDKINPIVNPRTPFDPPAPKEKPAPKPKKGAPRVRNNKVHEIEVTKWKETASGHWRRALNGSWPSWIDRIVIRLKGRGKGGEMRIFGWERGTDITCTINEALFTLERKQFPRGAGNVFDLDESELKVVMAGDYKKIKAWQRRG